MSLKKSVRSPTFQCGTICMGSSTCLENVYRSSTILTSYLVKFEMIEDKRKRNFENPFLQLLVMIMHVSLYHKAPGFSDLEFSLRTQSQLGSISFFLFFLMAFCYYCEFSIMNNNSKNKILICY